MAKAFHPTCADHCCNLRRSPEDLSTLNQSGLTFLNSYEHTYTGKLSKTIDFTRLLIRTDGGCRNNGREDPRAGFAVYFGSGSQYNTSAVLDKNAHRQTSQYAELFGVLRALRMVCHHHYEWDIREVVIATDSETAVLGLTQRIHKWKNNGWITAKGTDVANSKIYKKTEAHIQNLKAVGVKVKLWAIPREWNYSADAMVTNVLY